MQVATPEGFSLQLPINFAFPMYTGSDYGQCEDEDLFLRFHLYISWQGDAPGAENDDIGVWYVCATRTPELIFVGV
jgi:hypothetical protein